MARLCWSLASRRGGGTGRRLAARRQRREGERGRRHTRCRPCHKAALRLLHRATRIITARARDKGRHGKDGRPLLATNRLFRHTQISDALPRRIPTGMRSAPRGIARRRHRADSHSPRLGGDVAHAPATSAHTPTETTPVVRPPGERRRRSSTVTPNTRDTGPSRTSTVQQVEARPILPGQGVGR